MANEVETGQTASAGEEVKKDDAGASTAGTDGVDLAGTLAATLEKLAKAETDRDNYKRGMLKAKGKTQDEEAGESASAESPDLKQLTREVQELKTAIANKSQIATTGQGVNTDTTLKVGDNMLSEAQLNDLKSRGWDDKKIARFKLNLLKAKS